MKPGFRITGGPVRSVLLMVFSALYLTFFANLAFFRNFLMAYGDQPSGLVHLASVALLLFAILLLVLALLCWPVIQKPVLTLVFLSAAITAYFMDTYNVVIDPEMFANLMATDPSEVHDLISLRMIAYLLFLGIVPSTLVWMLKVRREKPARAVLDRLLVVTFSCLIAVAVVLSSTAFYSSYLRENKTLRYFSNPLTPLYSLLEHIKPETGIANGDLHQIGLDAEVPESDVSRELIVMVVGETARADRFSLNGYERKTNPELSRLEVISFSNVISCGTSTVVSLPCMFSLQNRSEFNASESDNSENALDVLTHAGVNVIWRDNNSSSKGVAVRVPESDFRGADVNHECDVECRDVGMLQGLQAHIDSVPQGDILIVLHQMGSHGPAYFRRYPKSYEYFRPTCETSMLDTCTIDEIGNSYDNTILYTDHFLASVISMLEASDEQFETAMFYVGDHGESLGESGIYLHGYPYAFAPDEQTRVPMIMWFGENYDDANPGLLSTLISRRFSHDNVFHTLLGLFEIDAEVYDSSKDILKISRQASNAALPSG